MNATKSCRRPLRRALPLLALTSALCAQAAPVHWQTPQLDIVFDPDTFVLKERRWLSSTFDPWSPVSMATATYSMVSDGIRIDLHGLFDLQAESGATLWHEEGQFLALVDFQPRSGYAITGYTLILDMDWMLHTPDSHVVAFSAGSMVLSDRWDYWGSWEPPLWQPVSYVAGPQAPALDIVASARGGRSEDCDPDGGCWDIFGYASLYLNSVTLQAHVVPVPEPGGWALAVPALAMVAGSGLWRRHLALRTRL
ncbi:MAG: hypothetical protein EOP40_06630 [Rubrivivax sp.]|nr:MAG: hypothetical protein EOP40_06630 [Rubrivivax sp.]